MSYMDYLIEGICPIGVRLVSRRLEADGEFGPWSTYWSDMGL